MADFDKEFKKLMKVEGGYVNDPDDAGGETYMGISRRANPQWNGWRIIDDTKMKFGAENIDAILKDNENVLQCVKDLYKVNYWDPMMLDHIPSQKIAHQLFDDAVNRGVKAAIRLAEHVMDMSITGEFSDELLYNLMKYGKNK